MHIREKLIRLSILISLQISTNQNRPRNFSSFNHVIEEMPGGRKAA
uniref:Uncharacterized protein n=1 Tax=Rhizophora mucronata TaxID=61149 RepID=A0A2P2Q2Y3_RHIMU